MLRTLGTVAWRLSLLLGAALTFSAAVSSAQAPSAPARCPRRRVSSGDACAVSGQRCAWPCGREGSASRSCTCGGSRKVWSCTDGFVCGS